MIDMMNMQTMKAWIPYGREYAIRRLNSLKSKKNGNCRFHEGGNGNWSTGRLDVQCTLRWGLGNAAKVKEAGRHDFQQKDSSANYFLSFFKASGTTSKFKS